ncbi:MAG: cytochrome C oxidase Cbb3 [Sphingobacteriales bacterium 41-5]|nr:MAG: cytochrome C oxidase Cbb3 [Sphingobacteriales bacterium 41-5]
MKFVNYLEKITGVGVYPMISLIVFTLFFIGVVIYAIRTPNETVKEMENLPLDNEN